jgi:NAD(P)-dependent dehydrogenase (short-subunit alcohol dehydrogenase family)
MSELDQKVALVLGASTHGGIGEAIAKAYRHAGAKLMLGARRVEEAEKIARDLGGHAMRCDVTREEDIAALVAATLEQFGRLDIAVDVAGGHASEPLDVMQPETLRRLFEINVVGPAMFIKHCARAMTAGGSIVIVSSHSAQLTTVGIGPYACTKASVERLVEVAAFEYGSKGIRVNTLSPGMVPTPMSKGMLERPGVHRAYERETPLGRLATVDEVAAAALWLASDRCFTTGDRIRVGGGIHLRRFPLADEIKAD